MRISLFFSIMIYMKNVTKTITSSAAASGSRMHRPRSLMYRAVLILCLLILPFNILSVQLSAYMLHSVNESFRQSITTVLSTYAGILDQRMTNINVFLYDAPNNNPAFLNFFKNDNDWHYDLYRYNVTTALENALDIYGAADALFVYNPAREDLLFVQRFFPVSQRDEAHLSREEITRLCSDSSILPGRWQLHEKDGHLFLLRIIQKQGFSLGAYISCEPLIRSLESDLSLSSANVLIMNGEPAEERGILQCSAPLSGTSAQLVCRVLNSEVTGSISRWMIVAIVMLLLSLAMIPAFILLFRREVSRPLATLRDGFHELEQGHESYRIRKTPTSAEFEDTYRSFNIMAETTASLREHAMQKEQERHALEVSNLNLQLDNLRLQIRPHFLQNMMNLLFTLVQNHQEQNAMRLILYLSQYFRYMFRYGRELELFDKELSLVREYLAVSSMHYKDTFSVSWQIDPVIGLLRFPPLLLHNFVENILQHALIPGRTVHIVIFGEYDEDNKMVTLQVSDDGRGMPDYFADMINRGDFSSVSPGKHIGIRNSINRLKHYYHGNAGVCVETAENIGTTVTITIPANLDEEPLTPDYSITENVNDTDLRDAQEDAKEDTQE